MRYGAGRGLFTVLAVGLLLLASATGVAVGANGTARADFSAQARELGLTTSQARELQARADTYVATTGGTQVSVNKILLGDRGEIELALPGGKTGPSANAVRKPLVELCPGYTMCAWKNTWYTGDKISMWACYNYRIPWLENGSWINNQSKGTVANFLDDYGVSQWHDAGAFSQDPDAPWYWVHWIKNC
ncbi:hypothetical protein ACIRU8_17940 [Streptomyces sp. NPDC101175]|uniref:hypothetical protein n=1 Tax=Streptomyces sp. NPDC101175 TaxID=3366123 RepID=UPI003837DCA8